jgi:hypothetical protein
MNRLCSRHLSVIYSNAAHKYTHILYACEVCVTGNFTKLVKTFLFLQTQLLKHQSRSIKTTMVDVVLGIVLGKVPVI